jgi:signal transduction histidine kinase
VVTADNKIQRIAWAHADPAKQSAFDELFRDTPPVDFANHPASRTIRTGKPEFASIDDDQLKAATTLPLDLDFMREIGIRSFMTVPVGLGERRLGALSFAFGESGRRHHPSDLVLGEEVARRAAFALENARLYEEAQQAIRVREQILAIVSHDLGNPLGAILVGTRMLSKSLPPENKSERLREGIERIRRSAERMRRLTEDLLDFASIQAGRLAIKRKACDPASILAETVASFNAIAQEKGLHIESDAEANLPPVYCDRDRIVQVLSNVVGNAVKVTPAGLDIVLRAEARGHEVVFAVSDTGPGIPEEQLQHIFERYWRGSEPEYKGTGLGLAIAKGIVDAHGGRIWAESRPGHGATFFFTIPAVVD